MKTLQKGFTLIELVVVIVILGILGAVAVPRFVNLSDEANTAALSSVAGAMGSAMAINYAACAASATPFVAGGDCIAVVDCDEVDTILQGGVLPTGYTVAAGAMATPAGTTAICVVTQTATGNTANFTGIRSIT